MLVGLSVQQYPRGNLLVRQDYLDLSNTMCLRAGLEQNHSVANICLKSLDMILR